MFDVHKTVFFPSRWCCAFLALPMSYATADKYAFDPTLLRGSVLSNSALSQFNQQDVVTPGSYQLDLYLNGQFLERDQIRFVREGKQVLPCFDQRQLARFGLKNPPATTGTACLLPGRDLKDIAVNTDISQLHLDLSIPQALLNGSPRGSVNPASLDSGESMAFINYNLNQYHVSYRQGQTRNLDSTYANLNGGFALGLWRYRQQSSYRYDHEFGGHLDTSRRYIQRAILPWRSEMLLGEGFTDGHFFSGLGFRGVQLSSDDRMLADSQRGYAPVVRGVAKSNARVTVLQGKSTLYETTVAPGPFAINDLYATNYAGDLTVMVTEADGSVTTFTVPFAAVPESIRPGQSRYSATVGRSRYVGDNDLFSEVTWQHGLTNELTFNLGNQLSDGYQAILLGGVYSSWLGAFGMDTTYSHASLPEGGTSGWMLHLSYSRTFSPTDTTLSIAGYRYSTEGFRDLSDVLGVRRAAVISQRWQSDSYRQRSRFEVAINQGMDMLGSLTVSGSTQDYRDQRGRDNQLQLGWGKTFGNGVALNLSITRTRNLGYRVGDDNYRGYGPQDNVYSAPLAQSAQTVTAFSLSFPIGRSSSAPSVSLLANHSQGQGGNYQTALSGSVGEQQPVSYGLNFTTDDNRRQSVWGGNLQTRLPYTNVTGSLSAARQYRQGSLSLQGAVVGHRGGVTLGPYVGDTFALIDAPGASGALVMDGQGARVDRFGYALAPALVPYHYNTIALNPEGMNDKTELEDGQRRVAPYAGATVRLRFNTVRGQALLITAQRPDNAPIPMGANVFDPTGKSVGMVGQANQIYLRSDQTASELTLNWGDAPNQQCKLRYQLPETEDRPIQRLNARCR
ncbi:fimbria/pilus outer membrane usher protein [Serratia grimesii]|uniref:fimbria/pilus outer membrane usher protein n=2 Tax=Serratia TaxID=613 RepID=UPI001AE715D2|nr:fimbria/pilus outer membrane usher protein [Serratia grimesii]